jgi:hypothetical protein
MTPQQLQGIYKVANVQQVDEDEEDVPKVRDWKRVAKIVGTGVLGMSVGTGLGYGAGHLLDRHYGRIPSTTVARLLPPAMLGLGGSIAYSLWKDREAEELKNAVKPDPNYKPAGK